MTQSHTPGPWFHNGRFVGTAPDNDDILHGCYHDENQAEANARLIAEAGTVATETGLTPRQLAEQRAELLAEAKWALDVLVNQCGLEECEGLNSLRAAIAKTKGLGE